ncbi:MAG: type II toxin-antitoxin system VapC family toxin [Candidatus Bathyarchaeales archaeon]
MVRVYLELSVLIALANPLDLFHNQTKEFLDRIKRLGFEPISCRQAVEMDLAIGVAKRPLRVTDALRILEAIDAYGIKLLSPPSRTLLLLVNEYLKEMSLKIGDLLHYAGATLLDAEYIVSWNTDDFNSRFEKFINKVNKKKNLKTIKVGTPNMILERLK